MDKYIKTYDNVFDNKSCEAIIQKFEDAHQSYLNFRPERGPVPTAPHRTTIHVERGDNRISFEQIRLDEDDSVSKDFIKIMEEYLVHYKLDNMEEFQMPLKYGYEAVRIKRYQNNNYDRFDPHVDVNDHDTARRFLAFFLYLNDVDEGGETEFLNIYKPGTYIKFKIKPQAGRMVVFPPMFPWPHAGLIPISGPKFLLHSYIHYV